MINIELLLCILLSALFIIDSYFYYFHYREKKKLITKIDDLFDKIIKVDKKLDSSINLFSFCHVISEKRYFCNKERIEKLYNSPHLVFFSKRRDKNG